jgi:uncharacterized membrane protein YadS
MFPGFMRWTVAIYLALFWVDASYAAVDSYRYLHVTIDTPWFIFLFLLMAVLAPFVLMAILVWRYTERRAEPGQQADTEGEK